MLDVRDVTVRYDTATVLDGASLKVEQGELVALVGPNGAGKTTLLRAISGVTRWERDVTRGTRQAQVRFEGTIEFEGERIDRLSASQIARRGLVLIPERGRPFAEMTVRDNLLAGAYMVRNRGQVKQNFAKVYDLFPRLKEREKQTSGTLSGGERQMLCIGRALMHQPKFLLVDEPSSGLAPMLKEELFRRVGDIYRELGVTILLAEQDVSFAFDLAARGYVLSRGRTIAQGTPQELLADEGIRKVYLGL